MCAAEFCCNGNVVEDSELGHVIQLQGDQRKNVSGFLVANKLAKKVCRWKTVRQNSELCLRPSGAPHAMHVDKYLHLDPI